MARLGYKFSNLCGTVYKGGNLVFTPDGNTLLSPVGNRITAFELVSCVHDGRAHSLQLCDRTVGAW